MKTHFNKSGRWIITVLSAVFGFCLVVASADAQPVTNGLVGYYKLNGNANDSSTNSNHASTTNGADFVASPIGQALRVDGTTQYAEAPITPTALQGSAAKSMSVWFMQTSLANKSVVAFGERA